MQEAFVDSPPHEVCIGLQEAPKTKIKHKIGKKAPSLGGLRDFAHLSGCLLRRKESIKAKRKPWQPSGDKHYMVKRKKRRDSLRSGPSHDRKQYVQWKHKFFKTHGLRSTVTFEEWWQVLYGNVYETGNTKQLRLIPYDLSDVSIRNMYVAYIEWGANPRAVFLIDAEEALQQYDTP